MGGAKIRAEQMLIQSVLHLKCKSDLDCRRGNDPGSGGNSFAVRPGGGSYPKSKALDFGVRNDRFACGAICLG
jgi:hypothetical protein